MAELVLLKNPLRPLEREHHTIAGNFLEWLLNFAPRGFGGVTKLFHNGRDVPIDDWDFVVDDNDFLVLAVSPGGAEVSLAQAFWNIVISMVISAVVNKLLYRDPPRLPNYVSNTGGEENTVYSLSPKQNAARIGAEIPVNYGNPLTTPDYASQPYVEYTTIDIDALATGPGLYSLIMTSLWSGSGGPLPHDTILASFDIAGSYELWESDDDDTNFNFIQVLNTAASIDPTASATQDKLHVYDAGTSEYIYGWFWNLPDTSFVLEPSGGDVEIPYEDSERGDGDQYLYYLLSLGLGNNEIEKILLADTDINEIQDESGQSMVDWMSFTYSEHGGNQGWIAAIFNATYNDPGLFSEDVYSSVEVGSQVFDEPISSPYFPLGNKNVDKIFVDISFDRGFYWLSGFDSGALNTSVAIGIYVINRATGLIDYAFHVNWNRAENNLSPLRRSLYFDVTPGLYSVSVRRITPKNLLGASKQDAFTWVGLRGHVSVVNFPNFNRAQILAMRIRATEQISQGAQTRVRVKLKRLLPDINGTGSTFTTNPALIVRDVMTNTHYGAGRPASEIDMTLLESLRGRWSPYGAANGWSGVFNGTSTIYEAMKTVLSIGAAQVLPIGNQLSFAWDGVKPLRAQLFTGNNIVKNSLKINYDFDRVGAYDGVTVEYRDADTWQPAFVTFPSDKLYTQKINLFGCTSATLAQDYAEYFWSQHTERRKGVEFQTELEGLICRTGDRIAVAHWIISPTFSALIEHYDYSASLLTVDREIENFGSDYYIILRDEYGLATNPIPVDWYDSRRIQINDDTNLDIPIYFAFDDTPTHFALGLADQVVKDFIITEIVHEGDLVVTIRGEKYIEDYSNWGLPYLVTPI